MQEHLDRIEQLSKETAAEMNEFKQQYRTIESAVKKSEKRSIRLFRKEFTALETLFTKRFRKLVVAMDGHFFDYKVNLEDISKFNVILLPSRSKKSLFKIIFAPGFWPGYIMAGEIHVSMHEIDTEEKFDAWMASYVRKNKKKFIERYKEEDAKRYVAFDPELQKKNRGWGWKPMSRLSVYDMPMIVDRDDPEWQGDLWGRIAYMAATGFAI